ncbi:beta-galactosidase [Bacteroidaceae bacterium 14-104]|nr:beta-galactosidase [Phocaeicola oris]
MKKIILFLLIGFISFFSFSCNRKQENTQSFNLKKISKELNEGSTLVKSDIFNKTVLLITPDDGNKGITVWKKGDKEDWNTKYFSFEVYNKADYSGVINLEFYQSNSKSEKQIVQGGQISGTEAESPWISCLIGVLPKLKTKVIFPLSYLDAQNIFLERFPRQLKATVTGNRLDPADISKVVIRFGPNDKTNYRTAFEIASISLSEEQPEPYEANEPIIDKLGQRIDKSWGGKLKDEKDLINRSETISKSLEGTEYPSKWSKYGGWKEKKFQATGFFRTQYDGTRWWLVDPEGYAFLSAGIDCVGTNATGPYAGIEDLFEWLPNEDEEQFKNVISQWKDHKTVDFYVTNLIRIYGKDWRTKWENFTINLLKKTRFNTIGNWSDINFAKSSHIPYVLPLSDFPSTKVAVYRDFPDVFSDEYQKNAEKFAQQLNNYKDDPYLIGYFLRNEPNWAFGYHNLAYEMFATTQVSESKKEFIHWLENKYKDIKAINEAWKLNLSSPAELKDKTFKDYPSDIAKNDFNEFSEIMVKKYVDIPCDEVAKVDKNHLNLGMRYAWISSDLLYKAGERFDVFSINGYGMFPPQTAEISERSGKPVMIGEFHHGAVDCALPATGITGVMNQKERAIAYRNYMEDGFSRPELVGMHYFQWIDQPYTGRFDGENYNIGIVTTANIPYEELVNGMTETNERIYEVASKRVPPYRVDLPETPAIHY